VPKTGGRKHITDFPALTPGEQIARLTGLAVNALAEWGVTDTALRLISYRENAVFEVRAPEAPRAVLRVHRQGYHSRESLASELEWMGMLARGGLGVPKPVPAKSGALLVDAAREGVPGGRLVDMLGWLDGHELGVVGLPLDLRGRDLATVFRDIGRTMAELHNLSTAWPRQNAMTRHAWDRDGLVGDNPLWGHFWDLAELTPGERKLMLEARTAIAEDLDSYGRTTGNYGLIHADLAPENVILDGDKVQIIDFDDSGFGWHMFDIVSAIYWLAGQPAYETIRSHTLEGYQTARPLLPRDLEVTDLFFAARSQTYLGWAQTRHRIQTAPERVPVFIELACEHCSNYLAGRR